MQYLNIENWNRKEHFEFFRTFEEPFFGIVVNLDVSATYIEAKEKGISFFGSYLHKSLVAANSIENFKYRIDDQGRVEIYNQIDASATISREDNTFGFSYIRYSPLLEEFIINVNSETERIQQSNSLFPPINELGCIYFSSLPWVKFTSLSHARNFSIGDTVPKISFGKIYDDNGRKLMPVSIHVHHALMDGYHVGLFVDKYQELLLDV